MIEDLAPSSSVAPLDLSSWKKVPLILTVVGAVAAIIGAFALAAFMYGVARDTKFSLLAIFGSVKA